MSFDKGNPQSQNNVSLKAFFESVPPGKEVIVSDLGKMSNGSFAINSPQLHLYCENETCQGLRVFAVQDDLYLRREEIRDGYLNFLCRNCREYSKTYSLRTILDKDGAQGRVMKFGESPQFGMPTPRRLLNMVEEERVYYLKGRRSENLGLGIAAFSYYRRVVENQKSKIISEIIKVAKKVDPTNEVIRDLEAALSEVQFSKAVSAVRHGLPQSLLIGGHNPLSLLHNALSEGLHAQTDDECLELATSIRVVLTDLVERIELALKEEAELSTAVSRLLRVSAEKSVRGSSSQ